MPIDRDMALQIARRHAQEVARTDGVSARLREDTGVEERFGWVFFYAPTASLHVDGEVLEMTEYGPILIERDGAVHETGTAWPLDFYLRPLRIRYAPPASDPDPRLDQMAREAWTEFATSRTAAQIAIHLPDDRVAEDAVRELYRHALARLRVLQESFGSDALDRVSDIEIRVDLATAADNPIADSEWEHRGILSARLSRTV